MGLGRYLITAWKSLIFVTGETRANGVSSEYPGSAERTRRWAVAWSISSPLRLTGYWNVFENASGARTSVRRLHPETPLQRLDSGASERRDWSCWRPELARRRDGAVRMVGGEWRQQFPDVRVRKHLCRNERNPRNIIAERLIGLPR